jgi:hypothetical protein
MPEPRVTMDTQFLEFVAPAGLPDPAYRRIARALAKPAFRRAVVRAAARACRRFPALARVEVRPNG